MNSEIVYVKKTVFGINRILQCAKLSNRNKPGVSKELLKFNSPVGKDN